MNRRTRTSILLGCLLLVGVGFGLYRLHQPGLAKAGVGPVGAEAYVLVRGERNQVQWHEGEIIHHWVGKPRAQPETVYFDGRQVHRASWAEVFSRQGFLIRFLPNRIDVVDLDTLRGEYFSPRTD